MLKLQTISMRFKKSVCWRERGESLFVSAKEEMWGRMCAGKDGRVKTGPASFVIRMH